MPNMRPSRFIPLALIVLMACSDSSPANPNNPPPAGADVAVGDNSFSPPVLQTSVGQAVVWQWTGANQHNVTFNNGDPGSATQATGTFSRTFNSAGSFDYFCSVHGAAVMSGTVTVTP